MFTAMGQGVRPARRARAAGPCETAANAASRQSSDLTAQEAQIARLVREGLTNPRSQPGSRTVERLLRKILGKLHITSHRQIHC